jgi:hypothetical protein
MPARFERAAATIRLDRRKLADESDPEFQEPA